MSELIDTLRSIIRDELARVRPVELATVTQVFPKEGSSSANNHQVSVKLRASGVELPRVPVTVARLGLSALPREGDLMVIAFAGGDLNAPVALGCVYDDQVHPPEAALAEVVYQVPDEGQSGVRRLHLELPSGTTVTMDDDACTVTSGDTEVVINRDGDVAIKAKGKVQIQAEGDIELAAQGDLKLSAQGNASLSGMSIKVEAQADAKLSGPQVTLAGITQFSPS